MKKNLREEFEKYIGECQFTKNLQPETIKGYRETFKHFIKLMPEITEPQQLTPDVLNEFFRRLQLHEKKIGKLGVIKTGVKKSTVRTYGSKLHSFFESLQAHGVIEKNPIVKKMLPKVVYNDFRALTKNDIDKIITAIQLHTRDALTLKRDMAMIGILLFCGLRRNELSQLKVRDVDLDKRLLTVRAETSKSGTTRQIPINTQLHLYLSDYFEKRRASKYVTELFIISGSRDDGLTNHGLKHWVNRLIRLSKVKFHLHRFRHTFAMSLVKAGVSIPYIQRLMGHTDLRMTERYLRSLSPEDLRESVNRLNIDNL